MSAVLHGLMRWQVPFLSSWTSASIDPVSVVCLRRLPLVGRRACERAGCDDVAGAVDEDELIEHWTLLDGELELLSGRRGATKLAFALILKFHQLHGRFPCGRGEFAG